MALKWVPFKICNSSPECCALAFATVQLIAMHNSDIISTEKVYFRSQILERPSIGEYWNIFSFPVLPENVIFTFFRTCWCNSEAYNTGTQKWSSIVQYSCTSIWDFRYTFSQLHKCYQSLVISSFPLMFSKLSISDKLISLSTPPPQKNKCMGKIL